MNKYIFDERGENSVEETKKVADRTERLMNAIKETRYYLAEAFHTITLIRDVG